VRKTEERRQAEEEVTKNREPADSTLLLKKGKNLGIE
jgi:hypothetical protein